MMKFDLHRVVFPHRESNPLRCVSARLSETFLIARVDNLTLG